MVKKKINVILDLDNTLISAIDEKEERALGALSLGKRMSIFEWKSLEGEYKVFARPHLQEFLTWLFSHFNVSVWTAASKSYALFIIDEFVLAGKTNRKLDYVLFSHHCREAKRTAKSQKVLAMLNEAFPLGYDAEQTYIVDDNAEVHAAQPSKCVRVKPFDVTKNSCENDVELKRVIRKLELTRLTSN